MSHVGETKRGSCIFVWAFEAENLYTSGSDGVRFPRSEGSEELLSRGDAVCGPVHSVQNSMYTRSNTIDT